MATKRLRPTKESINDRRNAAAEQAEQDDQDDEVRALALELAYALRAAERIILHQDGEIPPRDRDDWKMVCEIITKLEKTGLFGSANY